MSENKLTVVNAELGKAIMQKAIDSAREKFSSRIIAFTEDLLNSKQITEQHIIRLGQRLEMLDKQIASIEAGQFTVGRNGEISFNDKELNTSNQTQVQRCPSCGSDQHYNCKL